MSVFYIIFCLLKVITIETKTAQDCFVHPLDSNLYPLTVLSNSTSWIYPKQGENFLNFTPGTAVDFLCPGRNIFINNNTTLIKNEKITAKCSKQTHFRNVKNNELIHTDLLRCNGFIWRTIRNTNKNCANNAGEELNIGFKIEEDNRFLTVIEICFNKKTQLAHYSYIRQIPSINQRIHGNPRPRWLEGSRIYTINKVSKFYEKNNQRSVINALLGLPSNSTKYVKNVGNFFLSRGHLSPRSDGFYGAHQNATFFLANSAPQWQTVNGNNWKIIENSLRIYIEKNNIQLDIWTGIHGITTLPHAETGEETQLYLYVNNDDGTKKIPIPEIFWKVAYNPVHKTGVALIGVNNPYKEKLEYLCENVIEKLTWLTVKKDKSSGYCYACGISEFRKIVKVLPNFKVTNLLK